MLQEMVKVIQQGNENGNNMAVALELPGYIGCDPASAGSVLRIGHNARNIALFYKPRQKRTYRAPPGPSDYVTYEE